MRVRRVDETSEECFLCFFHVVFRKMEQNEDIVSEGVWLKRWKKLQKTSFFEEQKLWKPLLFGHFGILPKSTNFFVLAWFLEMSPEIFQLFSSFFYLRAHQLFSVVKFRFFLDLWAVVSAELQIHKNWNCLISRVGWRQMRGFEHFFNFFAKKCSETIKNSQTALTTTF